MGSEGCSTDSCLKTAYLSEDDEEDPETGVSMAGALQKQPCSVNKGHKWSILEY